VPALHTEDGEKVVRTRDAQGKELARVDWVMPFLAEAADFSADDSHKFDDQLDPMFDALAEMLIEQPASGGLLLPKRMRR
jgi:hypothetical protein